VIQLDAAAVRATVSWSRTCVIALFGKGDDAVPAAHERSALDPWSGADEAELHETAVCCAAVSAFGISIIASFVVGEGTISANARPLRTGGVGAHVEIPVPIPISVAIAVSVAIARRLFRTVTRSSTATTLNQSARKGEQNGAGQAACIDP
jgi:hypothetical protein